MSTETEERVVLDVELDAVPACDATPCPREGEWALKCRVCPSEILVCTYHRAMGDRVHNAGRPHLLCDRCNAPHPVPLVWRHI